MRFSCFCLGGPPKGEDGEVYKRGKDSKGNGSSKGSGKGNSNSTSPLLAEFPSLYQAAYHGSAEAVQAHLAAGASPQAHVNELNYTP